MHRIFVTLLLGAILIFVSYGQDLKNGTGTKSLAVSDTIISAKIPADTLSKKQKDTVVMHKDTTALYSSNTNVQYRYP